MTVEIGAGWSVGPGWSIGSGSGGGGGGTVTWGSLTTWSPFATQFSVAYNGTNYVSMGANYYNYSTDAVTWTGPALISGAPANTYLDRIAYGNGIFVAAGVQGGGAGYTYFSYSTTGTSSWSTPALFSGQSFLVAGGGDNGKGLVFGGGKFVMVGTDNTGKGYYSTSTDGVTWTGLANFNGYSSTFSAGSVIYTGSQFVAVGNSGSGVPLYTKSTDGATWTTPAAMGSLTYPVQSISYGAGTYVAVLNDGTLNPNPYWYSTSTNLSSWTAAVSTGSLEPGQNTVTYGNGAWTSVGTVHPGSYDIPAYSTSADGVTWTTATQFTGASTGFSSQMYNAQYLGGKFITVGREIGGSFNNIIGIGT